MKNDSDIEWARQGEISIRNGYPLRSLLLEARAFECGQIVKALKLSVKQIDALNGYALELRWKAKNIREGK